MAMTTTSPSLVNRMVRAARLEVPLYEEVEADLNATNQALTVVVLGALASGIGSALGSIIANRPGAVVGALIGGILIAIIGWAVWSYVVYYVGTHFFGGTATYGELLRTLGFAQSPTVLYILRFIPVLGGVVSLVVGIWNIVTAFIGIRQALDIDNTKTVFTILVALAVLIIVLAIVGTILGIIFGAAFGLGYLLGQGGTP